VSSSPLPSPPPAPVAPAPSRLSKAFRLVVPQLALLALLAGLAALDRSQRPALERMESTTALGAQGETAVFPLPADAVATGAAVVTLGGVPHRALRVVSRRDEVMRRAGTDDTGRALLYRELKREIQLGPSYWLRTGQNTFAELAPVASTPPAR